MKKPFIFLLLITFYISGFSQIVTTKYNKRIFKLPHNIQTADYSHNIIIVKYKTALPTAPALNGTNGFKLNSANVVSIQNKFPVNKTMQQRINQATGSTPVQAQVDLGLIYELKFSSNQKIEAVINELLQDKNVVYAEPKYVNHLFYTPNDAFYSAQSYLNQVKAPQAWDVNKNSSNVIIAIVDNGCELNHQDLAKNIYINSADPVNGIDDDHDGFVDNYYGWDFCGASSKNTKPDNDPSLTNPASNHGTHVGGLASAVSNNDIGIASIAQNAKLMIVKTAADNDPENIYMGYEGIKYAADHGAQIINCSWGLNIASAYCQDIINYALSKNCLIVAAAGNSGDSENVYPAAFGGVLAVASVSQNDVRSSFSNYGPYVGISAPGENILSTVNNNNYSAESGTSMSAPIVSSAAALVKGYFPTLTMQQIGERLRATADNIDTQNLTLNGQLGKGRLNVFNALTKLTPSIRKQNLTIKNAHISAGDIIEFYIDIKNLLDAASGLKITLTSPSPFVKMLSGQAYVGNIATLQTKNSIGPFKAQILQSAPSNSAALFQINYEADNYLDFENFSIPVAADYLNVQVNNIGTTMTSIGRVGFAGNNSTDGIGFIYKNHNYLYEASLMIGTSPSTISNNARNINGSDDDFVKKIGAKQVASSAAAFEGITEFDDSASPFPLNVYVKAKQLAYANSPDDKYSIIEYTVINKNPTPLKNVYIGLYTDWDVGPNEIDITKYDVLNSLAYTYGKSDNTIYTGVKLLSSSAPLIYYPLSISMPGSPLYNGFTRDMKYLTLSKSIKAVSLGDNVSDHYDVSFVTGYGAYTIPANDSVKVAFAFIAGDNLADIENSATSAKKKYQIISPNPLHPQIVLKQNYPNPVADNTAIRFSLPASGATTLSLYNSMGRKISTLINDVLPAGSYNVNIDATHIPAGIYIYALRFNNIEKALKMIITK